MPYLKISRDKRGYETYYLFEPPSERSRQSRPRLLFWFRTPPQVKVGREPFSEEIRQAIEAQHPDLTFDWPRLMAIQPPPADVQRWRERRRIEKAARQAAREEAAAEVAEPETNGPGTNGPETNDVELAVAGEVDVDAVDIDLETPRHSIDAAVDADPVEHPNLTAGEATAAPAVSEAGTSEGEASPTHARRRRRRRRRRHGPAQADAGTAPPSSEPPPTNDEV